MWRRWCSSFSPGDNTTHRCIPLMALESAAASRFYLSFAIFLICTTAVPRSHRAHGGRCRLRLSVEHQSAKYGLVAVDSRKYLFCLAQHPALLAFLPPFLPRPSLVRSNPLHLGTFGAFWPWVHGRAHSVFGAPGGCGRDHLPRPRVGVLLPVPLPALNGQPGGPP